MWQCTRLDKANLLVSGFVKHSIFPQHLSNYVQLYFNGDLDCLAKLSSLTAESMEEVGL